MKNVITSLVLLISMFGFSQSQLKQAHYAAETPKIDNMSVTVTVDSAAEVKSSVDTEDLKKALALLEANQTFSFELICKGQELSNGKHASLSYKITGNSKEKDLFLERVEKLRALAINYYNTKK